MKTIDITIPLVILAILALLFIGQTEINGKFPFIHIERPLCIFGAIFFALSTSCFYYQGKSDAKKEYLEELDSLKKNYDELEKRDNELWEKYEENRKRTLNDWGEVVKAMGEEFNWSLKDSLDMYKQDRNKWVDWFNNRTYCDYGSTQL